MKNFGVKERQDMFSEIGLSEETMHKWHDLFESRYPETHQSFLEWLGIDAAKISEIRKDSRTA